MLDMKSLTITNPQLTREGLLKKAEEIPGAWIGIRIAGLLLILSGWRSSAVSELFGLSRQSVVTWIQKGNDDGLNSLVDKKRSGRPPCIDEQTAQKLEKALTRSPQEYGLSRFRWDSIVVVEFLQKNMGISLKPRHARNWLHKLGFVLRQPKHCYVQATQKGIRKFKQGLKKNSNG